MNFIIILIFWVFNAWKSLLRLRIKIGLNLRTCIKISWLLVCFEHQLVLLHRLSDLLFEFLQFSDSADYTQSVGLGFKTVNMLTEQLAPPAESLVWFILELALVQTEQLEDQIFAWISSVWIFIWINLIIIFIKILWI